MRILVALVALGMAIASCSTAQTDRPTPTTTAQTSPSTSVIIASADSTTTFAPGIPDAEAYLLDSIEIVESNTLMVDSIDWQERRSRARQVAAGSTIRAHLYGFIREMLKDLEDLHWRFYAPEQAEAPDDPLRAEALPVWEIVSDRLGMLWIGSYLADASDEDAKRYAQAAHDALAEGENAGMCGWIIDLRQNEGGYLPPMMASVAPFLAGVQEGDADSAVAMGSFTDREGLVLELIFREGTVTIGSEVVLTVAMPHVLVDPDIPVAVLQSGSTASAGEMTLLAYEGRRATRTFGFPTAGKPAGTEWFILSDGAVMQFAAWQYRDRTGEMHDAVGPIMPDEIGGGTSDAIDWLLSQPTCNSSI